MISQADLTGLCAEKRNHRHRARCLPAIFPSDICLWYRVIEVDLRCVCVSVRWNDLAEPPCDGRPEEKEGLDSGAFSVFFSFLVISNLHLVPLLWALVATEENISKMIKTIIDAWAVF